MQVNSYKRLVENYWAPVSVSWGMDSRHSAVRVIAPPTTSASATRMEMVSKSHLTYSYIVLISCIESIRSRYQSSFSFSRCS